MFMWIFRAPSAADSSPEPVPELRCVHFVASSSQVVECCVYSMIILMVYKYVHCTAPSTSVTNSILSWKITFQIFKFPCLKLVWQWTYIQTQLFEAACVSLFDYFLGKILPLTKREMLYPFIKWLKIALLSWGLSLNGVITAFKNPNNEKFVVDVVIVAWTLLQFCVWTAPRNFLLPSCS